MNDQQLRAKIEEQQEIQAKNPPTSQEWQEASAQIKLFVKLLTGSEPKDAWGRK